MNADRMKNVNADLKGKKTMVKINAEKCIGCGLCAADCIALNIEVKDEKAYVKNDCFKCGHCVAICPAGAISIPEYDMADVEEYEKDRFELKAENVLHAIKFRRSIRNYKQKKVDPKDLEQILQAGRYTATAKNTQNCTFVFVQESLEELKNRVWEYIDYVAVTEGRNVSRDFLPFVAFNRRRKADPNDDYLFRNAPVVVYIATDCTIDAGLAAQNMENIAVAMGMGVLYNGFLARVTDINEELKKWLGLEGKQIQACMLLGYPDRVYKRTAPRDAAKVIWK